MSMKKDGCSNGRCYHGWGMIKLVSELLDSSAGMINLIIGWRPLLQWLGVVHY